ncbi:MAG: hypothetical protein KGJ13_11075 [Patescibacteria group bacterium]|nr:hypothetical protein [Patescibacteria group bacterium]
MSNSEMAAREISPPLSSHQTKKCSSCGNNKSLDEFHRRTSAKDGRQQYCKACVITRAKTKSGVSMPRQALNKELHSSDMPIEQKRDIRTSPQEERAKGDIAVADKDLLRKEYLDELKFMEEPVTIRIEPSAEENAAQSVLIACNGKGCEVMINDKWREFPGGWVPVGEVLTIKRKYLEVLARSKIDRIETVVPEIGASDAELHMGGKQRRFTRQSNAFSVLMDKNPRGPAWLSEVVRRNM